MNKKVIKELKTQLTEKYEKWKFEKIELVIADWYREQLKEWFFTSPYPPSYYYYHSEEEIRQREKEEKEMQILRIKVMELGIKDKEAEQQMNRYSI